MLKRLAFFVYGGLAYVVFLGTFLYAIAFVGGFAVPTRLDGTPHAPLPISLAIDAGLLAIFAVQHSVMARRWFKEWWTTIVPPAIERSTYVLCASLALILLFSQWHPLGGIVWNVEDPFIKAALWSVFASGWALVLVVTFLINHFDLFGLRQVWLALIGEPYSRIPFRTPAPYRLVRHPLYFGFLLAFWMTPTMTLAHLVFAIATTTYIMLAIQFEERDLVAEHGDAYSSYQRRVPMIVPLGRRRMRHVAAVALGATLAAPRISLADDHITRPPVPPSLEVSDAYKPFLVGHASGTQNYICAPAATPAGVDWLFIGPQATLFDDEAKQILTHFQSTNAVLQGGVIDATWQHSRDTSRVWARKLVGSSDPAYVAPGAIEWLLLGATGTQAGPTGGDRLVATSFIQRVNTSGGVKPPAGDCTPATVNTRKLVPYEADYFFYR
jgi:protein-S-isoprenylcysteine O-methyltransferase Ste14